MNTKSTKHRYMKWFDAQEMHEHTKKWYSEVSSVKDEQRFLTQLIQSFVIKPIDKKKFAQIDDFKMAIAENQRRLDPIFQTSSKTHESIGYHVR